MKKKEKIKTKISFHPLPLLARIPACQQAGLSSRPHAKIKILFS
tara:strand:+ start:237244 stop:237375 length:132 start_codon:yes stop_codon:yes gene_type:complete